MVCLRCSRGGEDGQGLPFPWQPSFFWIATFAGHQVSQQLCSTDDSTLLLCSPTIWTPTEGLRLVASCWSLGRRTRPEFEPKASDCGEPTGTAIDGHEALMAGRCCHKRRLENRLMVRRRDPQGSRQRGPRVRRTFESVLRSRLILPRASGHRGNIKVLI